MDTFTPSGPPVVVLDMDEVLYPQLTTFFEIMGGWYIQHGKANPRNAARMARLGFETDGCSVAYLARIAGLDEAWRVEQYSIICNTCNDAIMATLVPDAELLEQMDALHRAGVVFALLTHNYTPHALRVIERMKLTPYLDARRVMGDGCLGKERRKYSIDGYLALEERLPQGGLRVMFDDQVRNLTPLADLADRGWSGRLIGTAQLPAGVELTRYARLHDGLAAIRHELGA